jgi:hypothetical protein
MSKEHAMARGKTAGIRAAEASLLVALALLPLGCQKLKARLSRVLGTSSTSAPTPPAKRPPRDVIARTIYDGKLGPGWQDWGWGHHDLSHGPASIDFSNHGGFILWSSDIPNGLEGFSFRMAAPASFGSFLDVRLGHQKSDAAFPAVSIGPEHWRALPDGWVEVYVGWKELNPTNLPVDQLTLHARTAVDKTPVRLDKLVLTSPDPSAKPAAPATSGPVALRVDCRAPGHPISPYIYGVAGGGEPWDLRATIRRWGGNRTTRYNFELFVTNAGKDWFFENTTETDYREYLADGEKRQVPTAMTVPIIGWVAKDATSSGFPTSRFPAQNAVDGYRPGAGDGLDRDKKPISPGPPEQTSVPASPAFVQRWVEAIRARDAQSGKRGVPLYFLDNEPALWNANHRDIHPSPVSYDELLDRTLRYAAAVRAADPEVLIAGPTEWGWPAFFYSAKDLEYGTTLRPDRRAHGDVPLIPWYLARLREHEKATGKRLLDVLDVHFYPQGTNVYGPLADDATAALRIRSTRALWDPSYKDESWIAEPVRLIPRLRAWVAESYPGLRTSLGEYNFGGEGHMSGALAQAEALGRFGTERLDYAFYWVVPPKNSPAYWAFRAYRDFDGAGGHFLEQSIPTQMTPEVSLFASRDAASKRLVLVALNLEPATAAPTKIELAGCAPVATSRRFVYTASSGGLVADGKQEGGALEALLAPYSITVFDVELAAR